MDWKSGFSFGMGFCLAVTVYTIAASIAGGILFGGLIAAIVGAAGGH